MLLNNFNLAIRLLLRNPFVTFLNVAGLSMGLTAFYVLWPYAQAELATDQFRSDYQRMGRLLRHMTWIDNQDQQEITVTMGHCGIARAESDQLTEIEDLVRLVPQQSFESIPGMDVNTFFFAVNRAGRKEYFPETTTVYGDANVFEFFSIPVVKGNAGSMLTKPNTVALSERQARKYFGDADPVNRIIYLRDSIPFQVTGVFQDLPRNTHLLFDIVLSTAGIRGINETSSPASNAWYGYSYIKVKKGVNFQELNASVVTTSQKLYAANPNYSTGSANDVLQPLDELIFHKSIGDYFVTKSYSLLVILSTLAVVILAMGWINYVLLSIRLLNKRTAELGTRRVSGATDADFMAQFVIESAVINLIALLVAVTTVQLVKSLVEAWFKFYVVGLQEQTLTTLMTLSGAFFAGILVTSIYPVVISRKQRPVGLLKGSRAHNLPVWANLLVSVQYTVAIAILGWVTVVYFQLNFILDRDLGFVRDGVVVLDCPLRRGKDFSSKMDYFVNQCLSFKGVSDATVSKSVAGDDNGSKYGEPVQRTVDSAIKYAMDTNGGVDERFLGFYNIRLLEGRNFQSDQPADKHAVLISKSAAALLGFKAPDEALGATLYFQAHDYKPAQVIGVFEDYESRPLLSHLTFSTARVAGSLLTYKNFLLPNANSSKVSVKIDYAHLTSTLTKIEQTFRSVFPEEGFRWRILNDNINRHYNDERIGRNQVALFTLIAIVIAALGLLGMVANKAVEKTKEIGIRKVLGAKALHIAALLVRSTIQQLLIAVMVGIPLSLYLTATYLQRFSERISLHWWHYTIPVMLLIAIMFGTVVSVLIKASKTNPVDSLRYE